MAPVTALQVATLHKRPEAVRNICILAHIDHGTGKCGRGAQPASGAVADARHQ